MKKWNLKGGMLVMSMLLLLTACSGEADNLAGTVSASESEAVVEESAPTEMTGQIYLYGEVHANEDILERELELWEEFYNNRGMRHLFVELPYYTAELMNVWMKEEDNAICESIFLDWSDTASGSPSVKEFYEQIKEKCPETIFHGTDIGHQYDGISLNLYLKYLRDNDMEDSEQYKLTEENRKQGISYYSQSVKGSTEVYREIEMIQNFVREYEALEGEDIMGIYGTAHTSLDSLNYTNEVDCMATQLYDKYGDKVHSENLWEWLKALPPATVEIIEVNGKEYEASYFGEHRYDNQTVKFWRLEDAYEDFNNCPATGSVADYSFYPMNVEPEQVFVLDYIALDGTVTRTYHYDRGLQLEGWSVTEEFTME